MKCMLSKLRQGFLVLLILLVILAVFAILTNSMGTILSSNPVFLALACIFFIVSIIIWLFSWVILLKKRSGFAFKPLFIIGASSVFAALTPLQLGADAMRSLMLKNSFKMPFSESLAASMIVKGLKFLATAILASTIILFFFFSEAEFFLKLALLSGFCVIVFAAALFLLPINKKIGIKIAGMFKRLSLHIKKFSLLEKYFLNYSTYLEATSKKMLFMIFLLACLSLLFEFFALFFSFAAVHALIPIASMSVLFIIIIVLERTPWLPRGIGLVEAAGFLFLSVQGSISNEQIAAAIIAFDIARLAVPSVLSIIIYAAFSKTRA